MSNVFWKNESNFWSALYPGLYIILACRRNKIKKTYCVLAQFLLCFQAIKYFTIPLQNFTSVSFSWNYVHIPISMFILFTTWVPLNMILKNIRLFYCFGSLSVYYNSKRTCAIFIITISVFKVWVLPNSKHLGIYILHVWCTIW